MKTKETSTYITSVDDLFKYYLYGGENKLYVSNLISPKVVECFSEIMDKEIKIIYYDHREFLGSKYVNLKRNGRVKFKINKTLIVYKQTYYYYSKNKRKFKTTMIPNYIDKYCNYTKEVKNFRFNQSRIYYASYENTSEEINTTYNINISRQSTYLYERKACDLLLPQKELELWETIRKLEIEASGYYNYDEEYIKINKEVYVRLSLIDAHTSIIIKDILVSKKDFNKDLIKEFLINSLEGLPLECIITDGYRAYPKIIDEIGVKHQLCEFHIKQTLMKPYNRKMRTTENKIESLKTEIKKKQDEISKLEKEYPYKQGRTPAWDKKAKQNVKDRKRINSEKSELYSKLSKKNKFKHDLEYYKERINAIFDVKALQTAINKINRILGKIDLPKFISNFLKNLLKKIDRAVQFVNDSSIPSTNNLIELFYKVTFPGKIKRIFRTYEGAMNRIRLNDIRWMERNVIGKFEKNILNQ